MIDAALRTRLAELFDEGWDIWSHFCVDVRQHEFHPFVPADYDAVLESLLAEFQPGRRFLEWGSASGVITIMADLLGFDASGIELDERLVGMARALATKYSSGARFVAGSFLPTGYSWRPPGGDGRTGTIGNGESGYPALGRPLDQFDLVFAFPWGGEEPMMIDLIRAYGAPDATLLLNTVSGRIRVIRRGILEE